MVAFDLAHFHQCENMPDGTIVEQAESTRSAAEIYKNTAMTKADIEHLISMFWPDVRLKRFC